MPAGLDLPLGVDDLGRAKVASGTEQTLKLLITAIQPCPSDNPFQELGLDEGLIFAINRPSFQGRVKLAIQQVFTSFESEGRAKLKTVDFSTDPDTQELNAIVSYQDLETDDDQDIIVPLPRSTTRPRVTAPER